MLSAREHFESIQPLVGFERRLIRLVLEKPGFISVPHESLLRHAINLARIGLFRTPGGYDVDLSGPLADFRGWLVDNLLRVSEKGQIDAVGLNDLLRPLYQRCRRTRRRLVEHFADRLDPELLDREIRNKALVLVLGGGGGAGFAHLGLFSLLRDIDWTPQLIVGSSMGSLMGSFRALRRDWDPVGTLLSLPRRFDRNRVFRPYRGRLRYGFPGAFFLHLDRVARTSLDLLIGKSEITFEDLEIPLEIVVTGVQLGMKAALRDVPGAPGRFETLTGLGLRKRISGILQVLRILAANRRFLTELVLGRSGSNRATNVMDAIGFSCAVPGLFCYDLDDNADPATHKMIHDLVSERRLWGLADGGVTNNVPARVAWDSVHEGTVGTRNAFIYSLDPFAPILNSNMMYMPLQQIAAMSVTANQPYSDLQRIYPSPPSPLELVLSWHRARTIISETQTDLEGDRDFLERIKAPLPRFEELPSWA